MIKSINLVHIERQVAKNFARTKRIKFYWYLCPQDCWLKVVVLADNEVCCDRTVITADWSNCVEDIFGNALLIIEYSSLCVL
jgi:hypothetical protein